jgi:uncharacterized protein YegP (UPF0339 family)
MLLCSIKKVIPMGKFVISRRSNNEFQFNLKAANHQIILTSQGYSSHGACKRGVESVIKNGVSDEHFDRKESKTGNTISTSKQQMVRLSAKAKCMKVLQPWKTESPV